MNKPHAPGEPDTQEPDRCEPPRTLRDVQADWFAYLNGERDRPPPEMSMTAGCAGMSKPGTPEK